MATAHSKFRTLAGVSAGLRAAGYYPEPMFERISRRLRNRERMDSSPDGRKVPEGTRVYAVGDIHGRLDLLDAMRKLIATDAAIRKAERDPIERMVVVYLGDYVDRGPDSKGVIDRLIEKPLPGFEAVHLKGNHEDFMLNFLDAPERAGHAWLFNGGIETLSSYGLTRDPDAPQRMAIVRDDLARLMPDGHLDFLKGLDLQHQEGDYLFVHAGIRPGVELEGQSDQDLMWIREEFLEHPEDHGKMIVHGHTITWTPDIRSNRIGIDTGAFASDVLTCLVLEGTERKLLQT